MKRRRLGQHYLADPVVADRMVALAGISPFERVLEIGTGRGALTGRLAGLGASFEGYEIDERNFLETKEAVRGARVRLHFKDAFEEKPAFDVLVSSLPYSESARFIRWLGRMDFRRAVVILQEDFVRKILAPPGTRYYRGISVLAQLAFDIRVVERVQRRAFSPPPKVNSVIVQVTPKQKVLEAEAARITRLFSLRRRSVDSTLARLGLNWRRGQRGRRVNSLTPAEVHEICKSP